MTEKDESVNSILKATKSKCLFFVVVTTTSLVHTFMQWYLVPVYQCTLGVIIFFILPGQSGLNETLDWSLNWKHFLFHYMQQSAQGVLRLVHWSLPHCPFPFYLPISCGVIGQKWEIFIVTMQCHNKLSWGKFQYTFVLELGGRHAECNWASKSSFILKAQCKRCTGFGVVRTPPSGVFLTKNFSV